jgi:hypothetical protein
MSFSAHRAAGADEFFRAPRSGRFILSGQNPNLAKVRSPPLCHADMTDRE